MLITYLSHNLSQVSERKITVTDIENGSVDHIETSERILSMSVGFRYIVCITTKGKFIVPYDLILYSAFLNNDEPKIQMLNLAVYK